MNWVPPVVVELIGAMRQGVRDIGLRVTNARGGRIVDDYETIEFDLDGYSYVGVLRGRNRRFVTQFNESIPVGIAVRVLVDGDATPMEAGVSKP